MTILKQQVYISAFFTEWKRHKIEITTPWLLCPKANNTKCLNVLLSPFWNMDKKPNVKKYEISLTLLTTLNSWRLRELFTWLYFYSPAILVNSTWDLVMRSRWLNLHEGSQLNLIECLVIALLNHCLRPRNN